MTAPSRDFGARRPGGTRRASTTLLVLMAALPACQSDGGAPIAEDGWQLQESRTFLPADDPSVISRGPPAALAPGDFRIAVPSGVERRELALGARRVLSVGAHVLLTRFDAASSPPASGLGGVRVAGTSVTGSLYSNASANPLVLMDGTTVHGRVRTSATVLRLGTVQIDDAVIENAAGLAEEYRWQVPFVAHGETDRHSLATDAAPLDVRPGTYSKVVVEPSSSAVVHSGYTFIDTLAVRSGGTLTIDNRDGPVYLWVRDSIALDGTVLQIDPAANVMFGYAGTAPVRLATPLHGVLVAPSALVELTATKTPHRGAVFADSILVADNVTFEHRPFQWTPPASGDGTSSVTSADEAPIEVTVPGTRPARPYNVCKTGVCDPHEQSGAAGPDPSAEIAAAVATHISSCVGSCAETVLSPGITNCHADYAGAVFDCWKAETSCELGVAKTVGGILASASGTMRIASGGSLAYWFQQVASAYGIAVEGVLSVGLVFVGATQGGIMAECWPQYTVCVKPISPAFDDCINKAYGRFGTCNRGCGAS